jgi:hypothetical protein
MLSPSRWNISHTTDIVAPIDAVWAELKDLNDWEWNRWTKLQAENVSTGSPGVLKASYEGDDEWQTFDFKFGEVSDEKHVLTWLGSVGPNGCLFSGHHTMQLTAVDSKTTRLHHTEEFGGLLPRLGFGLPYKTIDRNYLYMNQELKKHVETKRQSL